MIARILALLLLAGCIPMFPYAVQRVFLDTPIEATMGTVQKIFYFHVPMAWICMLFAVVCGIAAVVQLARRSGAAEAVAIAAAEITVIAGLAVLVSGPLWGARSWSSPWTNDPRQVATALLWLVFVAYLLVRRFGPPNADRLAAGLAVFGLIDVPIIWYAVRVWKTTHPTTNVVGTLPAEMWASFWPGCFTLLACSLGLFFVRVAQERQSQALDQAWIAYDRVRTDRQAAEVSA
ncbi:MAG: cytochrome C assembly protein [Myxococcales bacterium FL481]|nr:MAG: cytochrome C assembly protein [Myxococcales bacterium FL481]